MSAKNHKNWITVGEVINLIKKPVHLYTTHIVQRWHAGLCNVCLPFGRCPNPGRCQTKKKPADLCPSCNGWYKKLAKSHRHDERQIKWRENCDTSEWPVDLWEVAKFFMPILGGNKRTTKDAESTDLASLLHVLAWMKDVAFAPDRRLDLDIVIKLRSEVRNPWAHAPNQELTNADLINAFDIGNKFVADLNKVFSCVEVKQCTKDIQFLQVNGISNVVDAELKTVNLLRDELIADVSQMKAEIKDLKEYQSSDRQVIKGNEKKLENLENRIGQLQNIVNVQENERRTKLKSCIPDKPRTFIGRSAEVKQIISSLVENGCGIISIVGGPGFGKSTVAVEVSHHLRDNHDIVVIFSLLSNVSTVPDVILRLCRDVGVNPGEDPESSLMFWLRNLEKKVVLVMDNIEQLLESNVRSEFTELVLTLRKNSQPHLQILTTTRTVYSIPDRTTENVPIGQLDEKCSVELLRRCCPNEEVTDGYLFDLAKLCGFVPLALCIAGSRIPDLDDPFELIQWLKEKPMKALQTADKSQCVRKTIEFSFQMLSNEDKKALVRLSVFNGNFQKKTAQNVIERDGLETQDFLEDLVARSLIQSSSDKRFVIHSLTRRFLADHDQLQDQKAIAQGLMVKHFLKVCDSKTIDSYSKDGFTGARESLKKDAHNVEETLKICSQDEATNLNPNIIEFLASSDIYNFLSRFFYRFGRDLFPQIVLRNFQESCIKLAKSRKQLSIEITFQCLVADQEGRKSAWKSTEYINRMEAIKDAFDRNKTVLKQDRSLLSYCYYFYARYYSNKASNTPCPDLPADDLAPLSEHKARSPMENVNEILISIQRGRLNKKRATKLVTRTNKKKYEEYMNCAESFFNQALSSAKESLGDHELTCVCHKLLGDLYFAWRMNYKALTCYSDAVKLRKNLHLDSNVPFVYLLKNYGSCFYYLRRFEESVKNLNEARDIADKLDERDTPCRAKVYYALGRTCRAWKPDCQEAAKYAKAAMEMQELLDSRNVKTLEDIIKTAEENLKDENCIRQSQNIINVQKTEQRVQLKSRIPDKPLTLIGRGSEVKQIISSLVENGSGIVSIVGGPGFGKSAVALEVSYHLCNTHDIVVIFSFLLNVSTVTEVILRLCHDVGVNPGEDPKSSLMFWLRNIERRVVLVMDNIEQLLESNVRSQFIELVLTLRNKSRHQLQILTTTRIVFSVPQGTTENVQIGELGEKCSIELLRKCCPNKDVDDGYLSELANLCGFVPIALCIAGSRIPDLDDPFELTQWLREKPSEILQTSNQNQCVPKVIEFSFQKLNDEDKKAIVRLLVFDGNFQRKSAEVIIERDGLETQDFLENLLARSLIQSTISRRFVIHSLIRRFLANHDQLQSEKSIAQGLMVNHFLKVCHSLTMDYFYKDRFTSARELLRQDTHNVEQTLKMCSHDQATNPNPNIIESLTSSDIYKSSSRFFYNFGWDLFQQTVLKNFHEYCIQLAEDRGESAIEITFQCLVAEQEGHKSARKSTEYIRRMEAIKESFDRNNAVLKEERSSYCYCYYFYARYYSDKASNTPYPDLPEDDLAPLPENKARSSIEKVDDALILIQRGHLNKKRATKVFYSDKEKYNEYMNSSKLFYNQALSSVKELLGDHEITSICHKSLGDLYFTWHRNRDALAYYSDAIVLHQKLQLDCNDFFVKLLTNCGSCLSFLRRFDESVEMLHEARDIAGKLSNNHTLSTVNVYSALARTCRAWKPDCQEASKYAKAAMEMDRLLDSRSVKTMEDIIRTAEEKLA